MLIGLSHTRKPLVYVTLWPGLSLLSSTDSFTNYPKAMQEWQWNKPNFILFIQKPFPYNRSVRS